MIDFNNQYNKYLSYFNEKLDDKLLSLSKQGFNDVTEPMIYSVKNGGKRIRPILCLAVSEALGLDFSDVINFAIAIELIHSYSLVHDDLECMDNDDYRRGQLSTHKKYGEAIGVLTGDALLNYAMEVALEGVKNSLGINVLKYIFDYSGANGMIKGQVLDIKENKQITEETLINIIENKTSKLITLPIIIPSILKDKFLFNDLNKFGYNLGMLFQITDDILDVESSIEVLGKTTNKDKEENKLTFISLYSLSTAKEMAKKYYLSAKDALKSIPNNEFLLSLTDYLYAREK